MNNLNRRNITISNETLSIQRKHWTSNNQPKTTANQRSKMHSAGKTWKSSWSTWLKCNWCHIYALKIISLKRSQSVGSCLNKADLKTGEGSNRLDEIDLPQQIVIFRPFPRLSLFLVYQRWGSCATEMNRCASVNIGAAQMSAMMVCCRNRLLRHGPLSLPSRRHALHRGCKRHALRIVLRQNMQQLQLGKHKALQNGTSTTHILAEL